MLTVTKEPQHARFTSGKVMIKDHYYYKGNGFSWSKPARVNEKYYPFFHKQQDENKARIKNMKEQEVEDKRQYEEVRRERLIEKKYQHRSVFESRVKEREVIQRMSNQQIVTSQNNIETEDDNQSVYEIVAKRLNSGKDLRSDEFSWNLLTKASKKNVDIYLGSYSVKGEEEMIRKIKERLEEEKVEELKEQKRQSEVHHKLREIFVARQEENIAKEERISRPATAAAAFQIRKSKVHHDNTQKTNSGDIKKTEIYGSATDLKHNTIVTPRSQGKDIRISSAVSLQRLTVSREAPKREFNIDSTECKGMLVQNMDKKICLPGNNFYDALTHSSKVFQEILDDNKNNTRKLDSSRKQIQTRPATSVTSVTIQSRPMTSMPKYPSPSNQYSPSINMHSGLTAPSPKNKLDIRSMSVMETDDFNAMQEINTFESLFCRGSKKVGYARVNLEEAKRLTSSQGLLSLQKIETKKQQPLVN